MPNLIRNKKARFNFEIMETMETGIQLTGTEVKSLRASEASLEEAYISTQDGELYLQNAHIKEYTQGNIFNHEPLRKRKLLAHKRDIEKWSEIVGLKGLTIIPLQLYTKGSWIKLEIGLAKGKDKGDKRQSTLKKEAEREIARVTKLRR